MQTTIVSLLKSQYESKLPTQTRADENRRTLKPYILPIIMLEIDLIQFMTIQPWAKGDLSSRCFYGNHIFLPYKANNMESSWQGPQKVSNLTAFC